MIQKSIQIKLETGLEARPVAMLVARWRVNLRALCTSMQMTEKSMQKVLWV